jgi:hypothetical protein
MARKQRQRANLAAPATRCIEPGALWCGAISAGFAHRATGHVLLRKILSPKKFAQSNHTFTVQDMSTERPLI